MGKRTNTATWLEKYQRWQIKVMKEGVRRTFTCPTPGRAGQRACNAKADRWLDDGIDGSAKLMRVLYAEYLETLKLRYSQSGWEKEDYFWRCHLSPVVGHKKAEKVSELNLQHVIDKAYSTGKSKKTLKGLASFIRSFMRYCRRAGATALEPELTIPKNAPEGQRKILQPASLVVLLNTDTTLMRGKRVFEENIYAFRFAVLTGLRPGELRNLKWSDVQGQYVSVRGAVNVKKENTRGKNNNAVRRFKMISMAQQALSQYREYLGKYKPSDPVFFLPPYPTFYKRWQRYCESNGIPNISLYELRHSFVSIAKRLEEGKIKPLVGHAENMDTLGIYAHQLDGDDDAVAEELNEVFSAVLEYGKQQSKA